MKTFVSLLMAGFTGGACLAVGYNYAAIPVGVVTCGAVWLVLKWLEK